MNTQPVDLTPFCLKHQSLLVHQAGYKESDPWRALLIIGQVVMFQMVSCDEKVHARVGGDVHRFKELGCLACLRPDLFGEVVQAACDPDKGAMKRLGDEYVARHGKKVDES